MSRMDEWVSEWKKEERNEWGPIGLSVSHFFHTPDFAAVQQCEAGAASTMQFVSGVR